MFFFLQGENLHVAGENPNMHDLDYNAKHLKLSFVTVQLDRCTS